MHAAPARYVSVSELYSADEVELLLDEIRELEPTSCRGEDVQDFEIAGSGLGCGAGGGGGAGGRSPCGTEATERSWDSHAHYSRAPPPRPLHVAPLYCRLGHLLTLRGATALFIMLCSISACGCVWAVVGVRSWLLPLSSRIRLLLLGAVTSALLHGGLAAAHVSGLAALLPVDWPLLQWAACVWAGGLLGAGGAAVLHAVLLAPEYRHAPPHTAALLNAAAGLGLSGSVAALVVVFVGARRCYRRHRAARPPPPAPAPAAAAAYRAVPQAPPAPPAPAPAPQPSTSRHDPAL